jgi:ABC-type oligopeptide transport system substrate-binding subunit
MYRDDALDVVTLQSMAIAERDRIRQELPGEYTLVPKGATEYVVFDVTQPPFDDRRVRRAFAHALDRHALVKDVLGDANVAATGGFVPPGMPGHSPGIGLHHDPDRARQLLVEAGFGGGEGFPAVEALTWPRRKMEMAYMLARWREVLGVRISCKVIEWGEYLSVVHGGHPPHLHPMGWLADYPDPDSYLRVPVRRQTAWRHAEYDQLVDRALEVTDQPQRMRLYGQADRILVEEAPVLPTTYSLEPTLIKAWVTQYRCSPFVWWRWKDVIIEPHE